MLLGALLVSALVLVVWFPAGALLHQRAAIGASAAELNRLKQQDKALTQEQKRLGSPSEIERIARQQYQLVNPGQRAYEVLPPTTSGSASSSYSGDPAHQPLGSPSAASELPPGSGTTSSAGSTTTTVPAARGGAHPAGGAGRSGAGGGSSTGFLGRVADTLEFWR